MIKININKKMSNKEIRSLTWKYFWKRKRQEVWGFLKKNYICALPISLICFISVAMIIPEWSIYCFCIIFGMIMLLIITGIIFFVYILIKLTMKWLRSNWKLATQDAIKELNIKGRK